MRSLAVSEAAERAHFLRPLAQPFHNSNRKADAMTSTTPTVDSCRALGTVDGREFAKRHIAAVLVPGIGTPVAAAEREIIQQEWLEKQAADHSSRRLDLACRGAGLEALEAYTAARQAGFVGEMDAFAVTMNGLATDMERETKAATAKLNRSERRKAQAKAKKASAQ